MGIIAQVNGLSFKQGTHLLATASDDKSSIIWDAEKGVAVTTLKVRFTSWPYSVFAGLLSVSELLMAAPDRM